MHKVILPILCHAYAVGMSDPLIDAIIQNDIREARKLYLSGIDLNRKYHGKTPLHIASSYGKLDMIAQLLDWGADPLVPDDTGRKIVDYFSHACESGLCGSIVRIVRNALKERNGAIPMKVIQKKYQG